MGRIALYSTYFVLEAHLRDITLPSGYMKEYGFMGYIKVVTVQHVNSLEWKVELPTGVLELDTTHSLKDQLPQSKPGSLVP